MTQLFDSALLDSHHLYHARYGRGAVIVAVRKESNDAGASGRASSDEFVARRFNARDRDDTRTFPTFDRILSIREEAGLVRMTVQFEYRYPSNPSYEPVSATIERVMPVDQITLDIVRTNETTR